MPTCTRCSHYYTRHAMVCPRCHPLGLDLSYIPPQDNSIRVGSLIEYENDPIVYVVLSVGVAPNGAPIAIIRDRANPLAEAEEVFVEGLSDPTPLAATHHV